MDRSTLEGDPHSLVEGMIIAGYAIGAQAGYIYCRAEYPLAIRRLEIALEQARELRPAGREHPGLRFQLRHLIKEGAGAFVCGEETALMASIQGERGQPWPRPPYPAVAGLWGAAQQRQQRQDLRLHARILRFGRSWFSEAAAPRAAPARPSSRSPARSSTGLIEVPMGITLREIIYNVGGGVPAGKALQGGADRRTAGRLPAGGLPRHAGGLQLAAAQPAR